MNLELFYKTNTTYSVTINPVDKYQYFGTDLRQLRFQEYLRKNIIPRLSGNYEMVIEYSEPRGMKTQGYKGPRLHLHGTLTFKHKQQLGDFLNTHYYHICRTASLDIDIIKDPLVWDRYIHKQHILTDKYKIWTNIV